MAGGSRARRALSGRRVNTATMPEQIGLSSPKGSAPAPAASPAQARWEWLGHWELWIALLVGAFLRLWQPDVTQFLADQAGLMQLARLSVQHGALPVTGIYSSINTLNPPLSVYVLLPFAWLTHDPLLALVSQECWNVLGVLFCYIFVLRIFGRRTAAISTILFATAGSAVDYSRLLWQQDYLPPFIALWAMVTFAGAVRGRSGWLTPAALFLTCAVLLHPTAALLAPALLLALLISPAKPRAWEYVASGVVVALLVAPTLIWELLSGWVDAATFQRSLSGGSKTLDPAVFFRLYQVLGGPVTPQHSPRQVHGVGALISLLLRAPTDTYFSPGSAYGSLGQLPLVVALTAVALFAYGWIVLTYRVFAPLRRHAPATADSGSTRGQRARNWLRGAWGRLREDPSWRAYALLWVSVTLPPATMIDHAQNVYPHYLLSLFPLLFVVSGIGAVSLLDTASAIGSALAARDRSPRWRRLPYAITAAALSLLIAAQTVTSAAMVTSFASGAFDASSGGGYGYLLRDLRSADAQLGALKRRSGARSIFIATTLREDAVLAYMLVGDHSDRASFPSSCLVLPGPSESPGLVAVTSDDQPAGALVAVLPGATAVASIPMPGGASLRTYQVTAPVAAAPGDVAIAPATYIGSGGFTLRLDAVALERTGGARLRWTVLNPSAGSSAPVIVRSLAQIQRAGGVTVRPVGFQDCATQRWRTGEIVYTWMGLPNVAPGDSLLVGAQTYTESLDFTGVGPVALLSAQNKRTPVRGFTISAASGATGVVGNVVGDWYRLPISAPTT